MTRIQRYMLLGLLAFTGHAIAETTWSSAIAPIIYKNCTPCHRADGAGPFPLAAYADVQPRAKMVAAVTQRRYMPPWKAAHGELKFANERGLTDAEIATLMAWVEAGAPEGDAAAAPPAPTFPSEWHNGKPDILLEMEADYTVPASGPDIYRNFVVRIPEIPKGKYLKGIDYKPRAIGSAHHTLYALDSSGEMRSRAAASVVPGFSGMESNLSTRRIGGWAVGAQPELFPDGVALAIPPGTDLVLNAHFHPTGKPEIERARIALYLTDQPPTREAIALDIPFGFGITSNIRIPAGDPHYEVKTSFVLPVAVQLTGVAPHAHLLAREISADATLPDGKKLSLIHVLDWDFAWQEQYRYQEPVSLPAGTRLDVQLLYDNSEANPNNPNHPPKQITWGPNTTDEMACVTMRFVSGEPADVANLRSAYGAWAKDAITHTDFRLVEHAVDAQERDRVDINGDGHITWGERWTMLGRVIKKVRGEDPEDELGLVPFLADYIFKTRVVPALLRWTPVVVLVVALLLWNRRRRKRARRARL